MSINLNNDDFKDLNDASLRKNKRQKKGIIQII
jgi:hypothetical protein